MAVSKRTRFEVLRRDNYTCRYCRSTDGTLTIDHVTPVALGGTDEPSNLVAACKDCNSGKSSTSPDAATVAEVSDDAIRWSKALEFVAAQRAARLDEAKTYLDAFDREWASWVWGGGHQIPRPANWRSYVANWREAGLPVEEAVDCAQIACSRKSVDAEATFRYACGVARNKIEEIHQAAKQHLDEAATPEAPETVDNLTFQELMETIFHDPILEFVVDGNSSWPLPKRILPLSPVAA